MHIGALTDDDALAQVYHSILQPAFPPEELDSLATMRGDLADGRIDVLTARPYGPHSQVQAVAVGTTCHPRDAMLLSYLAVRPQARNCGVGGKLLAVALDRWRRRYRPALVLAEVDDPRFVQPDPLRGDPAARLRFYQRMGAGCLDLPYFQPAIEPHGRVTGMLLLVLATDPPVPVPGTIADTSGLQTFLTDNVRAAEGTVWLGDPAVAAMLAALDRPDGMLMLLPADYQQVRVPEYVTRIR